MSNFRGKNSWIEVKFYKFTAITTCVNIIFTDLISIVYITYVLVFRSERDISLAIRQS